jgi:NADPH:quinone reductase-like Zn-dependent oxidoreductase
VRAVAPVAGESVVVSAAAGGVGAIATQLALRTGARVIALAGERNQAWLSGLGAIGVLYGDGQEERILAAAGGAPDGFIDLFGNGYVEVALGLGVAKERINTIFDFAAAAEHGISTSGTSESADISKLAQLAQLIADGTLEVPIARVFALEEVRTAYEELSQRHTHGKIVLRP